MTAEAYTERDRLADEWLLSPHNVTTLEQKPVYNPRYTSREDYLLYIRSFKPFALRDAYNHADFVLSQRVIDQARIKTTLSFWLSKMGDDALNVLTESVADTFCQPQEPSGYLHTMIYETGEACEVVSTHADAEMVFGKPGVNYSREYEVITLPLYTGRSA